MRCNQLEIKDETGSLLYRGRDYLPDELKIRDKVYDFEHETFGYAHTIQINCMANTFSRIVIIARHEITEDTIKKGVLL